MQGLGFTLEPEFVAAAAAAAANTTPAASEGPPAASTPSPPAAADGGAAGGSGGAPASAADRVMRDLRDTYLATARPPALPPWFLGPVEPDPRAATRAFSTNMHKHKGGASSSKARKEAGSEQEGEEATAAAAPAVEATGEIPGPGRSGPTGRGVGLRTTRAVAPGELLAVSVPLAIAYCRLGTTPENEDLADLMLAGEGGEGGEGQGQEGGGARSSRQGAAGEAGSRAAQGQGPEGEEEPLEVTGQFNGLTDLQQSLLGMLWAGHGAADGNGVDSAGAGAGAAGEKAARGGAGAGGVKRALLELVARSAGDASLPRSRPLVGQQELYRLVNANCMGEDFQVGGAVLPACAPTL